MNYRALEDLFLVRNANQYEKNKIKLLAYLPILKSIRIHNILNTEDSSVE